MTRNFPYHDSKVEGFPYHSLHATLPCHTCSRANAWENPIKLHAKIIEMMVRDYNDIIFPWPFSLYLLVHVLFLSHILASTLPHCFPHSFHKLSPSPPLSFSLSLSLSLSLPPSFSLSIYLSLSHSVSLSLSLSIYQSIYISVSLFFSVSFLLVSASSNSSLLTSSLWFVFYQCAN